MHQPVIDLELKAYVKQKKQINEKIQNHWKLELNAHVIFILCIRTNYIYLLINLLYIFSHWKKDSQLIK